MTYQALSRRRGRTVLLGMATLLALGCGKAPGATPAPAPVASPEPTPIPEQTPFIDTTAPSPGTEPSPLPSAASSAPAKASPASRPTPTPSAAASPIAGGPVTPLFVAPGERVDLTVPSGSDATLALSIVGGSTASTFALVADPGASADAGSAYRVERPGAAPIAWPFRPIGPLAAPDGPTRHVTQETAPVERQVGTSESFWIVPGEGAPADAHRQMAVLRRISPHAYFYVDEEAEAFSEAQWDALVSEFETRIYPRVTAVFGAEASPGVDGETRLFVVFSPAVRNWGDTPGVLGYFSAQDATPTDFAYSTSNHKEVLFMSDDLFAAAPNLRYGTLAHEFQHLINFTRKGARLAYRSKEALWLDEAMSMYAMKAAGYGLEAGTKTIAWDIKAFEENPAAYSLTSWAGNPNGYAYGMAYLFINYLVDRYGEGILPQIIASNETGLLALNTLLAQRGSDMGRFFNEWSVANLISGRSTAEGTPYRYASLDVRGTYGGIELPGITPQPVSETSFSSTLRPWSSAYFTWRAGADTDWRLSLSPQAGSSLEGAFILPE